MDDMKIVGSLEHLAPPAASPIIAVESWGALWPECEALMRQHRQELGKDRVPLDLDHSRIRQMEEAEALLLMGARNAEGAALLGYLIWFLVPSLESRGVLLAMQSAWYCAPEWRSRGVGVRLMDRSLEELRRRGVQGALPHHSAGDDSLGALLVRRWGAVPDELSYLIWF